MTESKTHWLPDVDTVADQVHQKRLNAAGPGASLKTTEGEELMVPYYKLSAKAREPIQAQVKEVFAAIRQYVLSA